MSGEAWTRELLAELRASRFAPSGWARFLVRSFARASERRSERPHEHRTVVALGAAGVAAWLLAALWVPSWLALAGATWWALQAAMLDWHLGMLERPDGSPLDRLGAANLITAARGGLPPALFALAGPGAGLVLLLAAAAGDVGDGWLARRRNETTLLGVWLDGTVDTLIVGAATLGAAINGLLPTWTALLVLLRLVAPWALAAGSYFGRARRPSLDGVAAGRRGALVAGAAVVAGLSLAFLRLPGGAEVAGAGAAAGMIVLSNRARLAVRSTTKGGAAWGRRSAASATRLSR